MPEISSPRLRVLVVSTLFPDVTRPHLAPFVMRQTQELAALPNVDVRVIAPVPMPPYPFSCHPVYAPRRALPVAENWEGLPVLRPRYNPWPFTKGRFAAASLTHILRPLGTALFASFPFDIIAAEYLYPDGPAAIALGKALGVPVSLKARGSDVHMWGTRPATAGQVRAAGHAAHGLLAVSAALRADMAALGLPESKILVHYTGVDLNLFRPRDRPLLKAELGRQSPLIVSVGALIPRKGQSLLIEALSLLPEATLVLIGDGADRAKLMRLAHDRELASRVHFMGALSHAEIARWLAAADVMALPSASEGLANAWLEALAAGTPVVICPAGGAAEVISNPKIGKIVDRHPQALAAGIRDLLENPPSAAECRAIARPFSWSRNAAALRDYLLLLAGK